MPDSLDRLPDLLAARFGGDTGPATTTEKPDSVDLVLRRRSERRYRPDPIPAGVLDLLLACYGAGPSK